MTLLALALAAHVMVSGPVPPSLADQAGQGADGVVESIVVHGNHTTPTADVLAIAGDAIGQPASEALVATIAGRLRESGRFAGAEVRRRFLSIADPTRVLLVIVVDEHAGVAEDDLTPGPMKRFTASGMWLPIVEYREGYGFTYGARVSFVDRLGPRSRVSVPLSWGGERQAQVELERSFTGRALSRIAGGGGVTRRENPHFDLGDVRQALWSRVESAPLPWLRAGAGARISHVSFGAIDDRVTTVGADVSIDTRVDPALPRNAVFVTVGIERLGFGAASLGAAPGASFSARRVTVDARGYVGLIRQAVLGLRAQSSTASRALPSFEQQLVGGGASLRGYEVGRFAGDNMVAFSTELVLPLTSPLEIGRFGVKLFADRAVAYAAGDALADQTLYWGYGAGAFVNATVFSLGVDVGWRDGRGRPNAHVSFGVRLR